MIASDSSKIVILLMSLRSVYSQEVVVTVQGRLRGEVNDGYVSFNSIPYATINEDAGKFKKAGLAPFWLGIREAPLSQCSTASDGEDCLRLDVHVPSSGPSPWPVLVWVKGFSSEYHPGQLVQQGIIVVVVYHRLGPLGFLCLNDEKVPGNAGGKDVVFALRWVRDNIVAFRGNPAKVVVAGQGFDAALVEALMLSPMAKGLYHGVILQSGTVLSPWAFNYDAQDRAKALSKLFGRNNNAASLLLDATAVDLVVKSDNLDFPYFPFGMCAEKHFKNVDRLLSSAPIDLLTNKQVNSVPMIVGYNSDEAYIFVSSFKQAKVLKRMSRDLSFLLPEELKFLNSLEVAQVVRKIKERYFSNNISMATVLAYHRDAYFLNHIHRSVRLHAGASHLPVYYYQFSHTGAAGVAPEPGVKKTGAAHSDELAYLFPDKGRNLAGEDGIVQQRLIKIWASFVKFLDPNAHKGDIPSWQPVDPHNPRLLMISSEVEMKEFPHSKATQMWDDIYDKYYYSRHRTSK